jgi:nicotinamidase-related amidase
MIHLPVRFTGERGDSHACTTLNLEIATTAFLLVDCNGDCGPACNVVIEQSIAPTLAAVRSVGMKAIFLYNAPHAPDGPRSMHQELHLTRRGRAPTPANWHPVIPTWSPGIAPRPDEPIIPKSAQSGFRDTYLDRYLRAWGIETIITIGFSFKSCLFYTLVGAFEHNYRVVFLRDGTDPPGTNEFPDTRDDTLPEKGWVRLVLTRLIEDHLGYSSTCGELIAAC